MSPIALGKILVKSVEWFRIMKLVRNRALLLFLVICFGVVIDVGAEEVSLKLVRNDSAGIWVSLTIDNTNKNSEELRVPQWAVDPRDLISGAFIAKIGNNRLGRADSQEYRKWRSERMTPIIVPAGSFVSYLFRLSGTHIFIVDKAGEKYQGKLIEMHHSFWPEAKLSFQNNLVKKVSGQ